ncbi:glycosyltransferase family 4 protein [Nesterenkonia muleiensis]|uniref:glycosyltransferase family 4 protein n=1 Tax=Nesterenkonia muleiensis TaxID=2282648 RepID=UPI000E71D74C|nr:glycosyltransferase family 4 protein [Nesterenkonia muleiensis]
MRSLPRIRFQVQPTVSHYREPLVRRLLESTRFAYDLVGRFRNSEAATEDRIASASQQTLSQVTPLKTRAAGLLWWEQGQVTVVWRGGHDAYVLEGRVYTVSTWAAGAAAKLRGRKVLLWGHGWKRPETGLKRRLRLSFYSLVDGLMVYGDRAKELGMEYGLSAEKIQVVYNSLYSRDQLPEQPPVKSPRSVRSEDRHTLIYSSRLTHRHRLDVLAEALTDWPAGTPVPRVVVVGEGSERVRLERVFAGAGVEAEFLGAVYSIDQLRELYARADAALSVGGAGLNVIQALGFGVPVVAEEGNRDSSPEIEAVIEGRTGRYYQAGSPESLRETLVELLTDPGQCQLLGANGLELVRARYTAEAHTEAIEVALARFLGHSP